MEQSEKEDVMPSRRNCLLMGLGLKIFWAGCGESSTDISPPRVVWVEPADQATQIQPNAQIRIRFDEPIDQKTFDANRFHLRQATQGELYGSVSYDINTYQGTLTIGQNLARGVVYQAVLEPGVSDLSGNTTKPPAYTWSFTVLP